VASAGHARGHITAVVCATEADGCPTGLHQARTELFAWQLEPVLAAQAGVRRMLIADRVGLGKTIQAAYITRTLLDRDPLARVLILTPTALTTQWMEELHSRVQVIAQTADAATLHRLRCDLPYLSTPWSHARVWIGSPDFLKQRHIRESMPDMEWSLLIVDEAHQVAGTSQRHEMVAALAARARQVVLLTATPHDGNAERFARLCTLGARGHDALTIFRRTTRPTETALALSRRTTWLHVPLSDTDTRLLEAVDSFERARRPAAPGLPLLCALFRKRLLSTVPAFLASVSRRLAILTDTATGTWHQPDLFDIPDDDECDDEERATLLATTGLPVARERAWLQRLERLAAVVVSDAHMDGRVRALHRLLRRSPEPAVVFTQYRDSVEAIARAVPRTRRVVALHGGLAPAEQRRVLEAFLRGAADTLVTTDVASQGLNLQHRSRWVITVEAPWTPLRLEQRIGRVDRLGQLHRVHATLLTTRHAFDGMLRARLAARAQHADDAPLQSCARWRAAAVRLAAWHTRLRAVGAHWRGPHVTRRPLVAAVPGTTLARWGTADGSGLKVVDVTWTRPDTGGVVERTVVAVPASAASLVLAAWVAARGRRLAARAARRAARLARTAAVPAAAVQASLFGIDRHAAPVGSGPEETETPAPRVATRVVAWLRPKARR
jgi:superfamily II DNA or RNA helicase